MLGFASGVMITACFWSLLKPSIEIAEASGVVTWMPALVLSTIGAMLGFAIMMLLDVALA